MPLFAEHLLYQQVVNRTPAPPAGDAVVLAHHGPPGRQRDAPAATLFGPGPVTAAELRHPVDAALAAAAHSPSPLVLVVSAVRVDGLAPGHRLATHGAGTLPDLPWPADPTAAAALLVCAALPAADRYGQLLVAAGRAAEAGRLAAHANGLAGRIDHRPAVDPAALAGLGAVPPHHLCTLLLGRPA